MNKYITHLLAIALGFIFGLAVMGLLSARAGHMYLEILKSQYVWEQEALALRAQQRGDIEDAVHRYLNVVDATSATGLETFDPDRIYWTFSFPFQAVALKKISSYSDPSGIGRSRTEGVNRAKLGLFLEKVEQKEAALKQYKIAAQLLGYDDIEKVRANAIEFIKIDQEVFERANQK